MDDDMDLLIAELRALRSADRRAIIAALDPQEKMRVQALLNGDKPNEELRGQFPFVAWLDQLSPPIRDAVRSSQAIGRHAALTLNTAEALAQIIEALPTNMQLDAERPQSSSHPSLIDNLRRFLVRGRSR